MRVDKNTLEYTLRKILVLNGVSEEKAIICANNLTENSLYGVVSHGVNRFPRLISMIRKGYIHPNAEPECREAKGALEIWDGHLGLGNCNAILCMDRTLALAKQHGIGCIALRNTNHWMRAGAYGIQAAKAGCMSICWTNTLPNMPTWGAQDRRIGNNPLVLCVPYGESYLMSDCAMAQYSYGAIEKARLAGKHLHVAGGYNKKGELTTNPAEIEKTWRVLPIGYWKGSAMSILLDLLASGLSGGSSVKQVGEHGKDAEDEYGLCQIFIAIDASSRVELESHINDTINYIKDSELSQDGTEVRYPGEHSQAVYSENMLYGIEVEEVCWQTILDMV